jgi:hypothetical protein
MQNPYRQLHEISKQLRQNIQSIEVIDSRRLKAGMAAFSLMGVVFVGAGTALAVETVESQVQFWQDDPNNDTDVVQAVGAAALPLEAALAGLVTQAGIESWAMALSFQRRRHELASHQPQL